MIVEYDGKQTKLTIILNKPTNNKEQVLYNDMLYSISDMECEYDAFQEENKNEITK